jgi:hypothetical protein
MRRSANWQFYLQTLHGTVESVRTHLLGLRNLQALGANLNTYPAAVLSPIIISVTFHLAIRTPPNQHARTINMGCAMCRRTPLLMPPPFDKTMISATTRQMLANCPDPTLNLLGSGFCEPATAQTLGTSLLRFIAPQRNYLIFYELSFTGAIAITATEFAVFSSMQQLHDCHLLALPFEEALPHVQAVVRLAFLISVFTTQFRFNPEFSYTIALVGQLKSALQDTDLGSYSDSVGGSSCWCGYCS